MNIRLKIVSYYFMKTKLNIFSSSSFSKAMEIFIRQFEINNDIIGW